MKTNTTTLVLTASLAVLLLAGCNRSETTDATPASSSESPAASASAPAHGRAIEITGNDAMKFSVTEITAKPGEALAVTLKNVGTMPKFSMGHNWVLLAADTDVDAFNGATAMAAKTDYIPAEFKSSIIAATKLLGPNESDTVVFHAPSKPGTYVFLCSFPGHFQVGMKGVLIVK